MIIVSYFGNVYLDHFKKDCKEIKKHGFDTILFCIPENDIRWNTDNIKAMKDYAESQNFKTLAGPWGLGGIFGGEAISTVCYERDGLEKVLALFDEWVSAVISMGFKTIFLDEPHVGDKTIGFVEKVYEKYQNIIDFYVCFCDAKFESLKDSSIQNLPVRNVGLSAYFWTNDDEKIRQVLTRWLKRLMSLRPADNHIWIQGFDLPEGREHVPTMVYNIAWDMGIRNFGFWGFKSAEATSAKRAANYKLVWKQTFKLFNRVA
jgi:hypothetical protein